MDIKFPKWLGALDTAPWIRKVEELLQSLYRDNDIINQENTNNNKTLNGSINLLNTQVESLGSVVAETNRTVARLDALSVITYNEFTNVRGGVNGGWIPTPTGVNIVSPTGRIEVNFGGSGNGGDLYFCYSVSSSAGTHVSRDSVQTNPARRVAVSGGASFAPSGFNRVLITGLPVNSNLRVTLEVFTSSDFVSVFGGSISARVAP